MPTIIFFNGPILAPSSHIYNIDCGAFVWFEGKVRRLENEATIQGIKYEAYQPMATTIMTSLAEEIANQYRIKDLIAEHSVGYVPVGSCSFRLSVASSHRKEALQAMDEFIHRMKQDVPIWKMIIK